MTDWSWLDVPVEQAARRLLGCELVRELDGELLRVRIVETEAYDQSDPASHTHRGPTARNRAMFLSAGHAYVYQIHTHHCLNVVTGIDGYGSGVLVRAVEPIDGVATMTARRGRGGYELTNGPGKVCAALDITLALREHSLDASPLWLEQRPPVPADQIAVGPRIGISRNADAPRRFALRGNRWVSSPRPS